MSKNSSRMWSMANSSKIYNLKEKIERYWCFWKKWGRILSEESESSLKMLKEEDREKISLIEIDSNDHSIYYF